MMNQRYYVYVLVSGDGHFQVGSAAGIRQAVHDGRSIGVGEQGALRLVYYEGYETQDRALQRKHYLEHLSDDDLYSMVHSKNPLWKDLSSNW